MERPLTFLADLRPAFLAHLANRLDREICDQTETLATDVGLLAPVRTFSALLYLARRGPATLAEISEIDGQSHQLLAQRLGPLEQLGLIERIADPLDRRRRPFRLTSAGRHEAERVEILAERLATEMNALFSSLGCDVLDVLDECLISLQRQPLSHRINQLDFANQ